MLPGLKVKIGLDDSEVKTGIDRVTKSFDGLKTRTDNLAKGFERVGTSLLKVGKVASIASGAIAGVATGLWKISSSVAAAGNDIDKNSKAVGLSANAYQELNFALGQVSKMTDEQFLASFRMLNTRLGQAGEGAENLIKSFSLIGVSQEDIRSGAVGVEEAFDALISKLGEMESPSQAAALAAQLLGEEAAALGPILLESGGSIDELRQKAEDLGLVMGQDAIDASAKFTDQMDVLKRSFDAVKLRIAEKLLPVLTDTLIPVLLEKVIPAIETMAITVGEWIDAFAGLDPMLQSVIGWFTLAFAVGGPVLVALAGVSAAISTLIAATGPIGLFIAAAALLYAAWQKWGDDIKAAIGDAVDWVTEKFDAFLAYVEALPGKLLQAGKDMIQGMIDGITEKWEELKAKIYSLADALPNWMKDLLDIQSPSGVFMDLGHDIADGLIKGVDDKVESVRDAVTRMADAAVEASKAVDPAADAFAAIGSKIESSIESALMSMLDGTGSMKDAMKSMVKSIIAEAYKLLVVKPIMNSIQGLFGGAGIGGGLSSMLGGLFGFEGGGYTGNAPRTGGLDGRGGMLAVVHPKETIVDHTRPQNGPIGDSVTVNQTINIETGVSQTVRVEMMQLLPRIVEASKAGVLDASRRGGQYGAFAGVRG